jgi:hypothetical protein
MIGCREHESNYLRTPLTGGLQRREDSLQRSPRCCIAEDCIAGDLQSYAIVTPLRTDQYLPLFNVRASHELKPTNHSFPQQKLTFLLCTVSLWAGRHEMLGFSVLTRHLLLQELACSVRQSNPDLELVVITVRGELSAEVESHVAAQARVVYVEDFPVSRNFYRCPPMALCCLRDKQWHVEEIYGTIKVSGAFFATRFSREG